MSGLCDKCGRPHTLGFCGREFAEQVIRQVAQDKRVCDGCRWFEVHPSGVSEKCNAVRRSGVTQAYFELRRDGVKQQCKGFCKL